MKKFFLAFSITAFALCICTIIDRGIISKPYYWAKLQTAKKIFVIHETFNKSPVEDEKLPNVSFNSRILPEEKRGQNYAWRWESREENFDCDLYWFYHPEDGIIQIGKKGESKLVFYSHEKPDSRFFKVINLETAKN